MEKTILAAIILFSSLPLWALKVSNPPCDDLVEMNDKVIPRYKTARVQTIRKEIKNTAKTNTYENTLQEDIDRKTKSIITPTKAKCSDFAALSEEYQPVAAFWVAGHSKIGKVNDGEVDEEYFARSVATLIEDCKATPTASFYDKTKIWLKKHI